MRVRLNSPLQCILGFVAAFGQAEGQQAYQPLPVREITSRQTLASSDAAGLAHVADLAITRAGEMVVLDAGSSAVTVFDNQGRVRSHFGRLGSGPGEFRAPVGMVVDSLVTVFDAAQRRASSFDLSGQHKRTSLFPDVGGLPFARVIEWSGGFVANTSSHFSSESTGSAGMSAIVVVDARRTRVDTVTLYRTGAVLFNSPSTWGVRTGPFGEGAAWTVFGDTLVIADGYRDIIVWIRLGARPDTILQRRFGSGAPVVTQRDVESARSSMGLPRNAATSSLVAPSKWSSASRIFRTHDGNIWVRQNRAGKDGTYVEIQPNGAVAYWQIPSRVELYAGTGARLFGIKTDELGAQWITVLERLAR